MGQGRLVGGVYRPYDEPSEEDAFNFLVGSLVKIVSGNQPHYGYDVYLPDVMRVYV